MQMEVTEVDTKQKQRIIGIIFLVILAVVAIPAFLKHSNNSMQPAPTMDAVSPTSDEASNQQGSPSAMPAEPMGQEQNQMPPQPSQALPSEPMNQQPQVGDQQPTESMNQQPLNQQPTEPMSQPSVSQQQPLLDSGEETQEPLPGEMQAIPSQEPPAAGTPAAGQSPVTSAKTPSTKEATTATAAASAKKSLGVKVHKQEAHVEKSDWTIRLAIFSVRANAEKLMQDLKKHGYKGHIEEINTYKGMTYKLTLKTKSSRADANKLAEKLNKLFHISVIVNRSV